MTRKRSSSQDKASPGIWPWLALGAFGIGVALAVGSGRRRPRREGRRTPPPEPIGHEPGVHEPGVHEPGGHDLRELPGELPGDAAVSWLSGPAGSLRIIERNPAGEVPVLFVHGLGGRAELWSEPLRALGPRLRGIALDLPGHGGSDDAPVADMADWAAAIGAVADSLRLRRFLLVAHSLGASAALAYAARHPTRVDGLFLVDPAGDQSRQPQAEREELLATLSRDPAGELEWYFRQLLAGSPPEVEKLVLDALLGTSPDVLLGAFAAGLEFSASDAMKAYSGPIFSVISDLNDLPYSLHRLRPDLEVRTLFGAGHWLMLDRPADLMDVFWDFLEAAMPS